MHGVAQFSASVSINETVDAFCKVLKFPKDTCSKSQIKGKFYQVAGFPNVLGCIDDTRVPIKRPPTNEEVAYVCRKGFHAVNIQARCDADMRFLNIVWPGATHDSFILTNSRIGIEFETNNPDGWLLGDSGYACRPWRLTPVAHPQSRPEERYNSAHCRTGLRSLEIKISCLHKSAGSLWYGVTQCHKIIYAAAQLHNYCIDLRMTPPPNVDDTDDNHDEPNGDNTQRGQAQPYGYHVGQNLIQQVFM